MIYHYFGRFTQAAARRKSIFDNAGIAAAGVERCVREWPGARQNVGRGGGPLILFFPPCCFEPAILEESVGDHRHERMTVKALPRSSLEVVKTKLFFHLLVSLLANPTRLDGGC